MKVTINYLRGLGACEEGLNWFEENKMEGKSARALCNKLIKSDNHNWALWLLEKTLSTRKLIRYAIFSAAAVIDIYEKKFPGDNRPREAINAAKTYIKSPTADNARAAADAARAADAAADAAAGAARAAYAAADIADAAYADAAADAVKTKIIRFGCRLVGKQNKRL